MSKGTGTKVKLIRILEYLFRNTDEEHGVTVAEVIDYLDGLDIHAERKSVYDDFLALSEIGFPVERMNVRPERYYLSYKIFELPELKLLVDAIQSTKFITKEKSRELIGKLELFAGRHRSGDLTRQVYVEGRVKTMNRSVLETVDGIHNAIREKKRVSFLYYTYTPKKTKEYRNGGKPYDCSPMALIWSDENYYLVAFDEAAGQVKNFRVDKTEDLRVTKQNVSDREDVRRFDPAAYAGKVFGMYDGDEELVVLECAPRLASVILDRFGTEPTFIPHGDRFRVALKVMISPNFYAWVMTFGADMEIVSPPHVRAEMTAQIEKLSALYGGKKESADE